MDTSSSTTFLASPIKDATIRCLKSFEYVLDAAHGKHSSRAEDNLARLRIWSGNIGAHHGLPNRVAADFRLREAPEIRNRILELLDDISETNDELATISVTDTHDESTPDDFDPVEDLCLSASDSITSLLKVSTLLRKATSRDRYAQALASKHDALPPEYAAFDRRHVAEKYPKLQQQQWLCDRLSNAITTRRRYLRYAQRHQMRIAHNSADAVASNYVNVVVQPTPSHAPNGSSPPKTATATAVSTAASTLQVQKLGELNLDQLDDDDNVSQATSFVSEAGPDNEYKSNVIELDKLTKNGEPFECLYCHGMVQFRNQRAWKKHVFRDLRAYVCTFPDCDVGLFEDRTSWFSHELECHRRVLVCLACTNKIFHDAETFQAHLQKAHSNRYPTSDQSLLDASSRPVNEIPVTFCPMCDEWSSKLKIDPAELDTTVVSLGLFKQHLASHQEQLALFSVTPSFDKEVDSDDASQKSGISRHNRRDILLDWQTTIDDESEESERQGSPHGGEQATATLAPESSIGSQGDFSTVRNSTQQLQEHRSHMDNASYDEISDLIFSAAIGDEEQVKDLLEKGVNMNIVWKHPLGFLRPRCGRCPDNKEHEGTRSTLWKCTQCYYSYLCHTCKCNGAACTTDPSHDLVRFLNARDGTTALSLAAHHDQWTTVKLLLEYGADILSGRYCNALLPCAISAGEHDIAEFLVENGANVNGSDPLTGLKPLALAVLQGQLKVMSLLLEHGANVDAVGEDSSSTLMLAIKNGRFAAAKMLLERGANADEEALIEHFEVARRQDSAWDEMAELFHANSAKQRNYHFRALVNVILSESQIALSKLSPVRDANKLCDGIVVETLHVIELLKTLYPRVKTASLALEHPLAAIYDLQPTLESLLTSLRSIHDAEGYLSTILVDKHAVQKGVNDQRLLEVLEQLRKSKTTIEYTVDHMELTMDLNIRVEASSDFRITDTSRSMELDAAVPGMLTQDSQSNHRGGSDASPDDSTMKDDPGITESHVDLNDIDDAGTDPSPEDPVAILEKFIGSMKNELYPLQLVHVFTAIDTAVAYDRDLDLANALAKYTSARVSLQSTADEISGPDNRRMLDSLSLILNKRAQMLRQLLGSPDVNDDGEASPSMTGATEVSSGVRSNEQQKQRDETAPGPQHTGLEQVIKAAQTSQENQVGDLTANEHLPRNAAEPDEQFRPSKYHDKLLSEFWAEEIDIAMIGLQNAGKTSLLRVLVGGEFAIDSIPTVGFNMKRVTKDNVTLKCWDLGGQPRFRTIWERYCRGINGIVFVVDSADKESMPAAREELHKLLQKPTLEGIPLLVLANKSDLPDHAGVDETIEALGLNSIVHREVSCYKISTKEGTKLDSVVHWLTSREPNNQHKSLQQQSEAQLDSQIELETSADGTEAIQQSAHIEKQNASSATLARKSDFNPQNTTFQQPPPTSQIYHQYQCPYEPCVGEDKGFVRKIDLDRHVLEEHNPNNAQLTSCRHPACYRSFLGRDKMLEHMRRHHKSDVPNVREARKMTGDGEAGPEEGEARDPTSSAQRSSEDATRPVTRANTMLELEPQDSRLDELDETIGFLQRTADLSFDKLRTDLSLSVDPLATGEHVMITPRHVVNLLESSSESLLLLDVRVKSQYTESHIQGALNLCLPITLLKRPSFDTHRLAETFPNEDQRRKFMNWRNTSYIVVYDHASVLHSEATLCVNIIKKFRSEGYNGTPYIIRGGISEFSRLFPLHVEKKAIAELPQENLSPHDGSHDKSEYDEVDTNMKPAQGIPKLLQMEDYGGNERGIKPLIPDGDVEQVQNEEAETSEKSTRLTPKVAQMEEYDSEKSDVKPGTRKEARRRRNRKPAPPKALDRYRTGSGSAATTSDSKQVKPRPVIHRSDSQPTRPRAASRQSSDQCGDPHCRHPVCLAARSSGRRFSTTQQQAAQYAPQYAVSPAVYQQVPPYQYARISTVDAPPRPRSSSASEQPRPTSIHGYPYQPPASTTAGPPPSNSAYQNLAEQWAHYYHQMQLLQQQQQQQQQQQAPSEPPTSSKSSTSSPLQGAYSARTAGPQTATSSTAQPLSRRTSTRPPQAATHRMPGMYPDDDSESDSDSESEDSSSEMSEEEYERERRRARDSRLMVRQHSTRRPRLQYATAPILPTSRAPSDILRRNPRSNQLDYVSSADNMDTDRTARAIVDRPRTTYTASTRSSRQPSPTNTVATASTKATTISSAGSDMASLVLEGKRGRRTSYLSKREQARYAQEEELLEEEHRSRDAIERYQYEARGKASELTAENMRAAATKSQKSNRLSSGASESNEPVRIESSGTTIHVYGDQEVEMIPGKDGGPASLVIGARDREDGDQWRRESVYLGSEDDVAADASSS